MKANINENELRLLAYLHEHAAGFTDDFQIDPDNVRVELEVTDEQLAKDASYLASHGLAGMTAAVSRDGYEALSSLWLMGTGEDYMRELEAQPGVAKKLTVAAVKEMGNALRSVAVQVLSDLFSKH
ncbi:MAG: hypothetical protein ABSH08_04010 [Tepidisphaeraceae bacterium]|jgi:hypothetical protein